MGQWVNFCELQYISRYKQTSHHKCAHSTKVNVIRLYHIYTGAAGLLLLMQAVCWRTDIHVSHICH